MDFIRKNWSRLSIACFYCIGGLISIIAWANYGSLITAGDWVSDFFNIALLISTMLYFFGMVGVTVVKMMQCSSKVVNAIYMAVGAVITILLVVFMIVANSNNVDYVLISGPNAVVNLYLLWVPFIVFGIHPLVKGITHFIEAETLPVLASKPAEAPVAAEPVVVEKAPVVAPATPAAPKATAPKAAAKKAAPKKAAK